MQHCIDCNTASVAMLTQTALAAGKRHSWAICVRCWARAWWRDFTRLWLEVAMRDRKGVVRAELADAYRGRW